MSDHKKGICWGANCDKPATTEYKTVVKEKPRGGARLEMTGKFCRVHFFEALTEMVQMNKQATKKWAET